MPAFLLVPDGGRRPLPAVVVHHQHHGEWHVGKSEVAGLAGDPLQALGPALARRGLVVLAPDAPGFEDRRASGPGTDPRAEDDRYRYLNEMGHRLVAGRAAHDDRPPRRGGRPCRRSAAHPAVDPDAVGVAGHSMGGTTTLFHAALDERVRFAAVSGAACTYRRRVADCTAIELASAIPGIVGVADLDDVVGLVAPRPLLLVSATEDRYSADADAIERRRRAASRPARCGTRGSTAATRSRRSASRPSSTGSRRRRLLAGLDAGERVGDDLVDLGSRSEPAIARALSPGARTRTVGVSSDLRRPS